LARIEKTLGYRPGPVRDDVRERRLGRLHRYQERKRLSSKAR
jgi:hypothetical protein